MPAWSKVVVSGSSAVLSSLALDTDLAVAHGGTGSSTAGGIASTKADEWADIQLIASGNNIKYLVNDKVVAGAKDSRIKKGQGMIAVNANSEVCIDNIIVQKETTKAGGAMDENLKGTLFGSSAEDSILLSEDLESFESEDLEKPEKPLICKWASDVYVATCSD